jgi:hypothetical protein
MKELTVLLSIVLVSILLVGCAESKTPSIEELI